MTRQNATGAITIHDPLPVALELMRTLAISVLEEHIGEIVLCLVCGSAWPCERVVVATHNLAVI